MTSSTKAGGVVAQDSTRLARLKKQKPSHGKVTGHWATGVFYRRQSSVESTALKLRNVTRLTAPGKIESEEFIAMKDTPETLPVRVEAKKK